MLDMQAWATAMQIELHKLPSWCCLKEKDDTQDVNDNVQVADDKYDHNTPVDEMVGKFIHKDFGGTVFGGTIVATDTCAKTKKKM